MKSEMEYFRSGLKSVLGAPAPDQQITGAETVERLVSRVSTSTLLEDRRDACRALKALSKKYRVEVGAHSMDVLKQVLELDRADCEIIGYCLDTLCNITSREPFEEETESSLAINVNIGEQFTEMFIKNTESVSLVLSFLEEYDFRVRWPAVKLITSLLANKPKEIQDIILVSPMGVSKLMDLLGESREVIRNDALLLLINLTKNNANIQKIVAFENAFDRLFEVIIEEGLTEGGIVVEDCLILMLNLLKNNTSNINFFKEGSYIQKIAPMLILPDNLEEIGWSPQKVSNMHCVLQLVRTLVSPNNPIQIITACQKSMRNVNLLEALCNILMASGVPADILTETINTVAEIIRGNLTNQEYFANVMAPSNPPRPAIVVLLMSMVNEKQPFQLRCAVLYCFECFLYKNEIGQGQIIQTLLPSSLATSDVTTGQLLCGGLFSNDSLSNWFSSISLSHCLIDNPAQKEQLLRVMIATNLGAQAIGLLHQSVVYLQQSNKLQSKIGILMLLAMWLSQCQQAVQVFLNIPGAMAFLTAQTSASEYDNNEELIQGICAFIMGLCVVFNDNSVQNYSKENLSQLIEKRVGIETYCKKLNEISRHEVYARAAKQPQILAKHSSELLLEFEFCKLFKSFEGVIINALGVQRDLQNGISELSLSEHENALLLQYKELIRDQDRKLHDLQKAFNSAQREKEMLKNELEELRQTNSQLNDQNTLLKVQLATNSTANNVDHNCIEPQEPLTIKKEIVVNEELQKLKDELKEKSDELEHLRKDQEDLLELLTDQDCKLTVFKNRLRELGEVLEDDDSENGSNSENEI
ncbi:general vesicular transport factor p115 [Coccinella septempunctata]|uniref:general vesicular transport factor p115 n=1 Tax=Coccinella septempunctata TaxID=41139 RepID=UPI001D07E0EC|nr:general vesicular transport factor p115 [Coccinella septempunctata]